MTRGIMRTIFIDLASHSGLLAVVDDRRILAYVDVDHRVSDSELLPMLEGVLREAACTFADLRRIACVTGPGGFTSLRIAATLANTLSDQLGIPIAGVHLSDVYAKRMQVEQQSGCSGQTLWLHSTKAHEIFVRNLGTSPAQWAEPTHVTTEELQRSLPKTFAWCGELLPAHEEIVTSHGGTRLAVAPLMSALPDIVQCLSYAKMPILPWYGRTW